MKDWFILLSCVAAFLMVGCKDPGPSSEEICLDVTSIEYLNYLDTTVIPDRINQELTGDYFGQIKPFGQYTDSSTPPFNLDSAYLSFSIVRNSISSAACFEFEDSTGMLLGSFCIDRYYECSTFNFFGINNTHGGAELWLHLLSDSIQTSILTARAGAFFRQGFSITGTKK